MKRVIDTIIVVEMIEIMGEFGGDSVVIVPGALRARPPPRGY